jgi:hypothetical protein|tara:strand:+ start:96 stop:311 length:216 start_codon:yes stop_codon:yes gene_type:complete
MNNFKKLVLKAAKSSGAKKVEIIHGSLFVTFTPGFVDVLANELKNVLQNLSKHITVKMYALKDNEYAYDFI